MSTTAIAPAPVLVEHRGPPAPVGPVGTAARRLRHRSGDLHLRQHRRRPRRFQHRDDPRRRHPALHAADLRRLDGGREPPSRHRPADDGAGVGGLRRRPAAAGLAALHGRHRRPRAFRRRVLQLLDAQRRRRGRWRRACPVGHGADHPRSHGHLGSGRADDLDLPRRVRRGEEASHAASHSSSM